MGQSEAKLDLGASGKFDENYARLHPFPGLEAALEELNMKIKRFLTSPSDYSPMVDGVAELDRRNDDVAEFFDELQYRKRLLTEFVTLTANLAGATVPKDLHYAKQLEDLQERHRQMVKELEFLNVLFPTPAAPPTLTSVLRYLPVKKETQKSSHT
jgi:hypothetical protein